MKRNRASFVVGFAACLLLACGHGGTSTGTTDAGAGGDGGTGSSITTAVSTTATGVGGNGGASNGGSPPTDPCAAETPACPVAPNGFGEGKGVKAIDRCAFGIAQGSMAATYTDRIAALSTITTKVTLADLVSDPDRTATVVAAVPGNPPGLAYAFRWNDEEEASTRWFPQGITGTVDASASGEVGGKKIIVVSSYDNGTGSYEKGARVAFVDVTDPSKPVYRFALLVEPTGTTAAPDFAPVVVHAGGMAWIGDLLYVVETSKGFRVFDMSHMLKVQSDTDTIGCQNGHCEGGLYEYVVTEVDSFRTTSACHPIFSFVSLDRSVSPPSLLSGEYCSTTACADPLAGRLFRFPLDETTGELTHGKSWPSEALMMGQRQVQGAASKSGAYFMSSSAPSGSGGELYRVSPTKSASSSWADSPEDLMIDKAAGRIWSLSEGVGSRYVFAASLGSYPPP